jgi:hypothetical protein
MAGETCGDDPTFMIPWNTRDVEASYHLHPLPIYYYDCIYDTIFYGRERV